jgi:parallel beta-helix repeat protein
METNLKGKKLIYATMLGLLSICMLIFAFNTQPAKSTWTGTVYIRADGSIDPPDAPIITYDNITYTLTDNITSSADGIVVERDNIVIDGAGYIIIGTGEYPYSGIGLSNRVNVTIQNLNIQNFWYGIRLYYSSNNSISGNNITANNWYGIGLYYSSNNSIFRNNITNNDDGIWLYFSSNNSIIGNNITNNVDGIWLENSYNNSIVRNNITANKYNFGVFGFALSHFVNYVDVSNLVDGKPIYYWINRLYETVPADAGYVALVNCTSIIVQNLNLTNNEHGILIAYTQNSTIKNNNITNNLYGTYLYESSNNSIIGNNITANNGYGIRLRYSSNNSIIGNNITANNFYSIGFSDSSNNSIFRNNITNNGEGIWLDESSNNSIIGNNITANNGYGIRLYYSSNNSISGNNITNNLYGIRLYESSNNSIYHNNFIDNTQQVHSEESVNVWDNGYPCGGNYWSDYRERYPDAEELDGSGLWDTPYIIDENNTDHYPLMYPYGTQTYKLTITTTYGGTTTPAPGMHTYANGTTAEVTAIPNVGFSFDCWLLDGEIRTENPITIIMDSNYTLEAYFIDDIPPEISDPWQDPPPDNVQPFQNVTVWVNVTDYGTGVKNVTLWYSLDNGTTWEPPINMTELPIPSDQTITYEATIPGYQNCTWVTYKIIAYDNAGNNATKDNNGFYYKYHVIPEYPTVTILTIPLLSTTLIIILIKKKFKQPKNTIKN